MILYCLRQALVNTDVIEAKPSQVQVRAPHLSRVGGVSISCKLSHWGMFKNNEAFHFMASHAQVCLDFKDQT